LFWGKKLGLLEEGGGERGRGYFEEGVLRGKKPGLLGVGGRRVVEDKKLGQLVWREERGLNEKNSCNC
jgi:hypothetical protein